MTSRLIGILEGKHPEVIQWRGLTDYLTAQLPIVFDASVKMAAVAIWCWYATNSFLAENNLIVKHPVLIF